MLVKLLANLGSIEFPGSPFLDGEEHEVNETLGNRLVRRNLAVDVTPEPKAVMQPEPIPVVPKQEPAVETASATAPKTKTSKEK